MTNYGSRLRAARQHAGLTQVQLATLAGTRQTTISTAEKEGSGSAYTPVFAQACGVDPVWLATGQGDMLPTRDEVGAMRENANGNAVQYPTRRLITLKGQIRMLDTTGAYEEVALTEHDVALVAAYSQDAHAYALRVKGDALHPIVRHDWLLVIEPSTSVEPGDLVLVHLADGRRLVRELIMVRGDSLVFESVAGGDRATLGQQDLAPTRGIQHIHSVVSPRAVIGQAVPRAE